MQDAPVIPVIVLHDVAHAVPLARALVAGGIRMLEVTLRTPARWPASRPSRATCPRPWWAPARCAARPTRRPRLAGARFAVSPGYTHAVGRPATIWACRCCPAWPPAARS
jgi:2-dehydro-3-deoxyphosphogluconate aldolase/(4S)-4-hydroxy-2-oxoglutarate aldolase